MGNKLYSLNLTGQSDKFLRIKTDESGIDYVSSIKPDYVLLDTPYTDAEASALPVGSMFYNSDQQDWLLKTSVDTYYNMGGEVSPLMKNGDSFTHLNGQPVYVSSGNGKLPIVKLASASSEVTSYTIAIATQMLFIQAMQEVAIVLLEV